MKITTLLALAAALLLPGAAPAEESVVRCANLIYAGTQTSRCFSDSFLSAVQQETSIATERRFKSVKLGSDELFEFPFVIMTGENDFHFTPAERENLKKYLSSGGFLLASAGCSNKSWDTAFRRELNSIFEEQRLEKLAMEHPIFHTVKKVEKLKLKSNAAGAYIEGLELNGKIVAVYSQHGLNDTANTEGCCCCGGNEIKNAIDLNVNIFAYALLY